MIRLAAIADCTIQLDKARLDGSSEILFGILAHLIVERGKPVSRGWLVDAFWWNADEADGRHCLRQSIYKLRQLGVSIDSGIDTFTLGERAARADFDCPDERTLALSPLPPEEAVAIFPGYAPRASAPFLTWLERTREKAGRAVRGVLVRALGEARRRNGWEEAAKLARQCLVLDPLNEEATLTLAEYTALQGDKREALRLIDSYMEEIGGTYGDLRIPASLLRNRISERVAYPPASAAGKIAIVGRDDSLRVLAGVSAEVSAGAGQTCVIHGPPGIGKTRLLTEYANISAMKGARIVRVDCHADAAERALSVFMELAPQLLRMPGALGCSPEALRLVRRLGRHDPTERLDPDEYGGPAFLHAAVRASLRDLIDAIAAERPLYLLIEDVHWIDPVSLEVLKEIIGSNRGRQLLVLMTTRTLGDGTLLDGVDRRQLIVHELAPLGDVASRRLAETLCGALAIEADGQLVDWCMQRAAGNPLFMTELLAHWRETKDTERVPVSLEALIDERVGALSEAGLRTLQAIALLEGEATYEMLEAVLGMQRWQVMGCVEELDKGGLVVVTMGHIQVRHDLLGKAAVAKASRFVHLSLHQIIAERLEALGLRQGIPETIWAAARHYEMAGLRESAVGLTTRGAEKLATNGVPASAAELLRRALRFASSPAQRLTLLDRRREALQRASCPDEMVENSEEALRLERELSGAQRVHSFHEISLYSASHQPTTRETSRLSRIQAITACATAVDAPLDHRLEACACGIATASAEGRADWALPLRDVVIELQPHTVSQQYLRLRSLLIFETMFGSLQDAKDYSTACCEIAEHLAPQYRSAALRGSGYPLRRLGEAKQAQWCFERAYQVAEHDGNCSEASHSLLCIAWSYADAGAWDSAWEYYERALRVCGNDPAMNLAFYRISGAEIGYMSGRGNEADRLVRLLPERMNPRMFELERRCVQMYKTLTHNEAIAADELADCTSIFIETRTLGSLDFVAGVLCAAIGRSRPSDASRLARDYATSFRRERYPISNPILLASLRRRS